MDELIVSSQSHLKVFDGMRLQMDGLEVWVLYIAAYYSIDRYLPR